MDMFIDKLAQKKNAQEMIRANSAAEAAKMEQMQKQMQAYDELMQEIRRVNIKTAENVENMRSLLAQYMEKLESIKIDNHANEKAEKQIAAMKDVLEKQIAAMKDVLEGQLGAVQGLQEEQLAATRSLLEERLTQTEDIVHKENVKVYRNVQAAFTEELEKKSQQQQQNQADLGNKKSSKLLVAILIGVLVDLAVNLFPLIM